jgi:hypothetical protein
MPTSFISEHSAELILVPQLIKDLSSQYPKITPIYFWSSREGGIMSRSSFQNKRIKILVLYPRRPKVSSPGSQKIEVNINELLLERAKFFSTNHIPVIAGVPLIDKLEDLHSGANCMWLGLDILGSEEILGIDLTNKNVDSVYTKPITVSTILQLIDETIILTWEAGIEKIKEIGKSAHDYRFFNRMSGDLYKPIYFLIHMD